MSCVFPLKREVPAGRFEERGFSDEDLESSGNWEDCWERCREEEVGLSAGVTGICDWVRAGSSDLDSPDSRAWRLVGGPGLRPDFDGLGASGGVCVERKGWLSSSRLVLGVEVMLLGLHGIGPAIGLLGLDSRSSSIAVSSCCLFSVSSLSLAQLRSPGRVAPPKVPRGT